MYFMQSLILYLEDSNRCSHAIIDYPGTENYTFFKKREKTFILIMKEFWNISDLDIFSGT